MINNTSKYLSHSPLAFANSLTASPLEQLQSPFLEKAKIKLFVKRDDLIHPLFGGNKWRKLKYNLIHARDNDFDTLLTFGGAWSNHIYATAAAGKHFKFNTIGIIRGEKHIPLNTTLSFAEECGMQLHYVNRNQYRKKNSATFQEELKKQFGRVYILPEGGSNLLAVKGCEEIIQEINQQTDVTPNYICCASGSGATLAGLASAINSDTNTHHQAAIGFSVLKGADFITNDINNLLVKQEHSPTQNWRVECDFHFGGYAKINDKLIHFMKGFKSQYNITLDAVYTAKMFYGLFELIKSNTFKPGTTIVAIHSGGLQGNKGFNL